MTKKINKIESALCECGNPTFFFITINGEQDLMCSKCGLIVEISNFEPINNEEKTQKTRSFVR